MITFFFYIWGVLAIWYEIWCLNKQNYLGLRNTIDKIEIIDNYYKSRPKGRLLTDRELSMAIFQILYFIWGIIGLFTSQWILFTMMFILSFINGIFKLRKRYWTSCIDSILSLCILFFIVLNKYHLHIDLFGYIKSLI